LEAKRLSPKTRFALILLTPIGLALAGFWFAAVFNALRWLYFHSEAVGSEMWWRTIFTLISAGGFAVMAYLFVKILRNPPRKRRDKK